MELGRPYWGTESSAGRWREKADVAGKKGGLTQLTWSLLHPA